MKKATLLMLSLFVTIGLLLSACGDDDRETTTTDDDSETFTATITAANASVSEGSDGSFQVSLDRSNDTGSDVTVLLNITGSNIENGVDFELANSVDIPNGSQSVTVSFSTNDDSEEGDKSFSVSIASSSSVTPGSATATVFTIVDNDQVTSITYEASLAASFTDIDENGSGTTLTVTLDQANQEGQAVTVSYTLAGTATNGSDYETMSGNVGIANGETTATIDVTLIDDTEYEGDETIVISLVASNAITLGGTSEVTIYILENEDCPNDNSTNQTRDACDNDAGVLGYTESVSDGQRTVTGSGIPNHDYGNQFQDFPPSDPNSDVEVTDQDYNLTFTANPTLAVSSTSIINDVTGRPAYEYGIALNAVPIDPAPAEPFIFENTSTGEYNWDWVFEPNNNTNAVGLDCATAHVQPDGAYHYHGDMSPLAELSSVGISSGTAPTEVVQIGWASDGFPIVYRYGPSADGTGIELLVSSYQLKSGERPGDGVNEPCGTYNGKYTNDYEFVENLGDLDECNGISRSITLATQEGSATETFSYFYVITEDFPVIGRCLSGTPDNDFSKGGM